MRCPWGTPVSPERDLNAGAVQAVEVTRLDPEGLLDSRSVLLGRLHLPEPFGRDRSAEPAQVDGNARVREVWNQDHLGVIGPQLDELIIDVLVSNPMGECVDPSAE